MPTGYVQLGFFNSTVNKYGKYSGLSGQAVEESEIYVKEYNGKIFLWWAKPLCQIDDFLYFGDRDEDIDECNKTMMKSGYTWHHTGWPPDEQQGTMQLVPTGDHSVLPM